MTFTTHNDAPIDTNGTHLQGYIACNYNQLVDLFGEPIPEQIELGHKVDWEWNIKFSDGTVATIYNWKNGPNYCGEAGLHETLVSQWHVGGFNTQALYHLQPLLKRPVAAALIPTDPTPSNDTEVNKPAMSADQIDAILRTFYFAVDRTDNTDALTDLLTDIRHYCELETLSFDNCLQSSDGHWAWERTDPTTSIIQTQLQAKDQ